MASSQSAAVVLGASISRLLAARALSRHFENVTVVERDVLPDAEVMRKGVPQSGHAHGLLASGYRVMDAYFPGLMDGLEDRGAPRGDVTGDFLWFQFGRWKLRHHSGIRGITVSRPCLEAAVRRRVKAIPNVTFLEGVDGIGPVFDETRGRVRGLVVRARETDTRRTVDADLVVDASGRGSKSPAWLEASGFERPREVAVRVNVGYATRIFERQAGDLFSAMGAIVASTPPAGTRAGAVLGAEEERWIVTLIGTVGDYPPTDPDAWNSFAATLPTGAVHDLVTHARPLTDIVSYRFPENRRLLYERLKRFPRGYLVIGDAVCSFNPIYGQGMSVAATEAQALDDCLERAEGLDGLQRRFFSRARRVVDVPWTIATGEDLRYPQTEGQRPFASRVLNGYLERVHAIASTDAVVCDRFFDVLNLLAPPESLLSPPVLWRVLTHPKPPREGSPWGTLPPERAEHRAREMQGGTR